MGHWWEPGEEETATDRRKREHLKRVRQNLGAGGCQEHCMHDACSECCGTGVKLNGEACFHYIACPCAKCTPRRSTIGTGTLCCV